jgi:hypothetical protein
MNKFNISIQKSIELLGIILGNIRMRLNVMRCIHILVYNYYGILRVNTLFPNFVTAHFIHDVIVKKYMNTIIETTDLLRIFF